MGSRRSATFVLLAAWLVSHAGAAHAAVYDVSAKNRFWCCTSTTAGPVFIVGAPAPMGGYISMTGTAAVGTGATPSIMFRKGMLAKFASKFQSTIPARKDIF